jgi:hypothetical protein
MYRGNVVGIDACSNEIGCRPEVFAQVFRYLSAFHPKPNFCGENSGNKMNASYHAGEDFLDIADGLRAIDEAILFCGLGRGNRLGHAIALGIDAEEYYKYKHKNVVMTKQDMLDNIAWIFGKSAELGLGLNQSFYSEYTDKFNKLFYDVYWRYTERNNKAPDICDYYSAWKLRGDLPRIYFTGKYKKEIPLTQYDVYSTNPCVDENIRKTNIISMLYHFYHYDDAAKQKGAATLYFEVDQVYMNVVSEIQKRMRNRIAQAGIAIEANPSSNILIGTFNRYSKHPMLSFYNKGLASNFGEENECPQLSVSINTDDQGVFDTLLENEYELMACALEKEINHDGTPKYKVDNVHSWIDNIRAMGIDQKFV